MKSALLLFVLAFTLSLHAEDWMQDCANAQRTGFTPETPALPWKFAWSWNGPDEKGGTSAHQYHQLEPHKPWETRVCTGGDFVFATSSDKGIFALKKSDGTVAWNVGAGRCVTTPAYDPLTKSLLTVNEEGCLISLEAATGKRQGSVDFHTTINKAPLVVGEHVYVLTNIALEKIQIAGLKSVWRFEAAGPHTLPAYSAKSDCIVFCTDGLSVHCVEAKTGKERWTVRPIPLNMVDDIQAFDGGWPVIAEKSGIVFVKLGIPKIDTALWSGGGPKGKWPTTNAAIRERLTANPKLQTLFALKLTDGKTAFIPAVGPDGVEDLTDGKPRLRPHSFPVVKTIGDTEVAYVHWRNGDTKDEKWDARWDSHIGEMTLSGLHAGDIRFVQFEEHGGWAHITDEACPLTMAGDTLFYAHWNVSQSARILDRSANMGLSRIKPITTEPCPPVARHAQLKPEQIDPLTHWVKGNITQMDGRFLPGPGWWVYANQLDPPTPKREAYSEGILPRYTIVADGLIIVEGNGGDLFVLRSGK